MANVAGLEGVILAESLEGRRAWQAWQVETNESISSVMPGQK